MKASGEYFPKELISMLKKQHYALFGHSAAKLCHWTKASLRGKGTCYKQKFYGIQSHRCLQMTPAVAWCQQQCVFCWRPLTTLGTTMKSFGEPEEIVDASIEKQRLLLTGYGALEKEIGEKKLMEANNPNQAAISLSGEPTTYPKLDELVGLYKKKGFTTFVVSNGMNPEMLAKIKPTQLYLSLESPTKEIHKSLNAPLIKDSWEKLNESLEIFPSLKTRKVIRITAVKGKNMKDEEKFAMLIEKAKPHYLEIKSYMFVGFSRQRLRQENMPFMDEVLEFSRKIAEHSGYSIKDSSKESRVVLLARNDLKDNDSKI